MRPAATGDRLQAHFAEVRAVIRAEERWERGPQEAQEFSPENLESLATFTYFGGFPDLAAAGRHPAP